MAQQFVISDWGVRITSPVIRQHTGSEQSVPFNSNLTEAQRFGTLSVREREVVRCLADGLQTKEVAAQLLISPKTIEFHKANIYRKLEIRELATLVRLSIRVGFIVA
jgi:two-component system, LuxR family, response regulator FixJ